MSSSGHLLEPHGLIVMNAYIIAAIFYKNIHDRDTLLYISDLERLHSTYRVYSSISFVKITSLFEQLCRSVSVACLLIDLSLESVELKQSWGVLDRFVHKSHGLGQLVLEKVMLCCKVQNP